jgi:hypothetical protein
MRLPVTTILFLVVNVVALSSCQTDADGTTEISRKMTAPEAQAIATDLTARLFEEMPPQQTAVATTNDGSIFSIALAQSLKSAGYAINPGPETNASKALKLTYSAFQDDGVWMAQVSAPSVTLSRAYLKDDTGAHPTSPLSVLRR